MASKKPSSFSSPIAIGNCEVIVESNNYKSESNQNSLQITLSRKSKIIISVVENTPGKESNQVSQNSLLANGNYDFVLVNPKDSDEQSKSLLQEVLTLYVKELPSMSYAANTGKKSAFLQKCISNGKYSTLVLKSNSAESHGEVVAAISFQLISADTQYAEVPLAAVSSAYQHKGIGQVTYLEMKKRLQNVGVHFIYCWADVESEGFWLKQGFVSVGQVDTKGRAKKLPIKADIRRALCFPGGSTLMIANLNKECSDNSPEDLHLPLSSFLNPPHKPSSTYMANSQHPGDEKVLQTDHLMNCCKDLVCLDNIEGINVGNSVDISTEGDGKHCSCSLSGAKKRTWEASHTSLNSKKVKGSHMTVCHSDSGCVSKSNNTNNYRMDVTPLTISRDVHLTDTTPTLGGFLSNDTEKTQEINCYRIMLMNIADDAKKSNLSKIIEDLGGSVTSDGKLSTHVITGKVRKTLNFCAALCSGAWVTSPDWLKESYREGHFKDEMPYILKDSEYKSKYRVDLKDTVVRARASPGTLFKGFDVCLVGHVQPPISTLSAIVRSAGGIVIRDLNKVKNITKTIFVASEENMEEALSAINKGIPTFGNEWFMNSVMKQQLDLDAPQFAESL